MKDEFDRTTYLGASMSIENAAMALEADPDEIHRLLKAGKLRTVWVSEDQVAVDESDVFAIWRETYGADLGIRGCD